MLYKHTVLIKNGDLIKHEFICRYLFGIVILVHGYEEDKIRVCDYLLYVCMYVCMLTSTYG